MKRVLSYLRQITGLLLVIIVGSAVFAGDYSSCPEIARGERPALAFVERRVDGSTLWVAHFGRGRVHNEEVISSKYLQVTQIDNAVFLVTASAGAKEGKAYVVDLATGAIVPVAENTRIHCLRAEPERGTAMLMDCDMGAGEVRLIEIDLKGLKTTVRHILARELLGDKFVGIGPAMRLSPDFKYIVYASKQGKKHHERWSQYTLRLLDLSTMEVDDLDSSLSVGISVASSFAYGKPAFEWISDGEILYQHIVADESDVNAVLKNDALHIFKKANVKTRENAELFRKELPLTLDGGSLQVDPLNGQLIYNDEWVLNPEEQTLKAKTLPFSIIRDHAAKQTQIFLEKDVLYSGNERCVYSYISSTRGNFAYSLRPRRETLGCKLYAKIQSLSESVKVAEDSHAPIRPVGWIE